MAKLYIVGIGPGGLNHMTFEAREALAAAEVIVGYSTYLELIRPLLEDKEVVSSGMMREVERCREALRLASTGRVVALVSSGDSGIYGMAGLALELVQEEAFGGVDVEVVPGVSAVQAAASVLGAPLMHDFAVISLSDLLTPWPLIRKRLAAAAGADFVVALYNPRSRGRVRQIEEAREILLTSRPAATPVGIVRNALRTGQDHVVTTLGEMLAHHIDMFSLVVVGNSATFVDRQGRMITPRGYQAKGERLKTKEEQPLPLSPSPIAASPDAVNSRSVMICGTASDVGKSVLTAGICRTLKNRGIRVAPFKSQNMSLNSAVTPEGGEIGRAQAVQAQACGVAPHTDMNPILLKPSSDTGSQVIVQGKAVGNMSVVEYNAYKPQAFARVRESFDRLRAAHDVVVIEGAGSIAEINLKAHDIANLRVAEMADCSAILVADIDRGGVFAQIIGTLELLEPQERARIKGVIINKFRGDPSLLKSGIDFVEGRTGIPVLGVVPWFTGFVIPDEDSVALQRKTQGGGPAAGGDAIRIGVVKLPRISNFTDFDALEAEPDVELSYVETPRQLAGLDFLILPGSKATASDLYHLMERGFFPAIQAFRGTIAGICGGYQMLGHSVKDPQKVESPIREAEGLGLLDVETSLLAVKETHMATARPAAGGELVAPDTGELQGYEIHMGETVVGQGSRPFAVITSRSGQVVEVTDGAVSRDGRVFGTYLHGLFDNDQFRGSLLNRIRREKGMKERARVVPFKDPYDMLSQHLERHLDMERILAICGLDGQP
jgi:adenosylcobyric acid synthase